MNLILPYIVLHIRLDCGKIYISAMRSKSELCFQYAASRPPTWLGKRSFGFKIWFITTAGISLFKTSRKHWHVLTSTRRKNRFHRKAIAESHSCHWCSSQRTRAIDQSMGQRGFGVCPQKWKTTGTDHFWQIRSKLISAMIA